MSDRGSRPPRNVPELLQWSIANAGGTSAPSGPSAEDRAWFREAIADQLDVSRRMKEIKSSLDESGPDCKRQEELLDELLEIVEDINYARDLRPIGGLPTLLQLLHNREAGLRTRAAAVLGAAAQNNEPVQEWLTGEGALPPLVAQLSDNDSAARVAAFTAVSCMVRHYAPARQALIQGDGLSKVVWGLSNAAPRIQRKAAQLCNAMVTDDVGLAPTIAARGASALPTILGSSERPSREAALMLALSLATDSKGLEALLQVRDMQPSLQRLRLALEDTSAEDRPAAVDEERLASKLAAALAAAPSGGNKEGPSSQTNNSEVRKSPDANRPNDNSTPLLIGQ